MDRLSADQFDKRLSIENVAARCQALKSADDRKLIYALQARAMEDNGFRTFANRLIEKFPDRLGPDVLREVGVPRSKFYNADEVRRIRESFPSSYLLNGETSELDYLLDARPGDRRSYPSKYPVSDFVREYQDALDRLPEILTLLCFEADHTPSKWHPWFFPTLIDSCCELLASDSKAAESEIASTEVSREVLRAIELATETRKIIIVHGPVRLGKSSAAKTFSKMNAGRCRYFQVPVYSDEKEFFREMAFRIGIVGAKRLTTSELRIKIEDVVTTGDFVLVIDEAHFVVGNSVYPRSIPRRLAWLCSLVDKGVGMVFITVTKFLSTIENIGKNTPWEPDQFLGRVTETIRLPTELCRESLKQIAAKWINSSDPEVLDALVDVAYATPESVAGIESIARRANAIAASERRTVTINDINSALYGGSSASTAAVATPLQNARKPAVQMRRRIRKTTEPAMSARPDESIFSSSRLRSGEPAEVVELAGK